MPAASTPTESTAGEGTPSPGTETGSTPGGGRATERKKLLLRLDPAVHDALARWAGDEMRSTNAQIEFLLRRALRDGGRMPGNVSQLRRPGRPSRSEPTEPGRSELTEPAGTAEPGRPEPADSNGSIGSSGRTGLAGPADLTDTDRDHDQRDKDQSVDE